MPVASLANTKDVFAVGLVSENVAPNGFRKLVPFVMLYGEFLVASIALPLVSSEPDADEYPVSGGLEITYTSTNCRCDPVFSFISLILY